MNLQSKEVEINDTCPACGATIEIIDQPTSNLQTGICKGCHHDIEFIKVSDFPSYECWEPQVTSADELEEWQCL